MIADSIWRKVTNSGKCPDWTRKAEFRYTNECGDIWYALFDGSCLLVTSTDVGYEVKMVKPEDIIACIRADYIPPPWPIMREEEEKWLLNVFRSVGKLITGYDVDRARKREKELRIHKEKIQKLEEAVSCLSL